MPGEKMRFLGFARNDNGEGCTPLHSLPLKETAGPSTSLEMTVHFGCVFQQNSQASLMTNGVLNALASWHHKLKALEGLRPIVFIPCTRNREHGAPVLSCLERLFAGDFVIDAESADAATLPRIARPGRGLGLPLRLRRRQGRGARRARQSSGPMRKVRAVWLQVFAQSLWARPLQWRAVRLD